MTRLEDRQILIRDIAQARVQGARLAPACALAGIDVRTLQRWKSNDGVPRGDRRPDADRPVPSHALSETERAQIIEVANEPRFASNVLRVRERKALDTAIQAILISQPFATVTAALDRHAIAYGTVSSVGVGTRRRMAAMAASTGSRLMVG